VAFEGVYPTLWYYALQTLDTERKEDEVKANCAASAQSPRK